MEVGTRLWVSGPTTGIEACQVHMTGFPGEMHLCTPIVWDSAHRQHPLKPQRWFFRDSNPGPSCQRPAADEAAPGVVAHPLSHRAPKYHRKSNSDLGRTLLITSLLAMTSLTSLPPELFACILDYIPSIDLQQTTISLLRIFSYDRIPNWRRYLFYHIHLKSADNVRMLGKHLQRTSGDAEFIKKFSLAAWTADADAAIEIVLMIPKLDWLSLCIGMSFAPDHLRHLFHKPMPNLRCLSLRFRP